MFGLPVRGALCASMYASALLVVPRSMPIRYRAIRNAPPQNSPCSLPKSRYLRPPIIGTGRGPLMSAVRRAAILTVVLFTLSQAGCAILAVGAVGGGAVALAHYNGK